jgi:hypothetical protein
VSSPLTHSLASPAVEAMVGRTTESSSDSLSLSEEFIRATDLQTRFPVLKRGAWTAAIMRGALRSHKIGRARVVRVSDVVAFLSGEVAG